MIGPGGGPIATLHIEVSLAPAIRAAWSKRLLERSETAPGAAADRIREAIAPEVRAAIESAGRLSWIDVTHHLALLEAHRHVLGPEAYVAFYRRMVAQDLAHAVLGAFTRGGLRLFGAGPLVLAKVLPRGWGYITRGCGEFTVVSAETGGTTVTVSELPAVLCGSDTYALTLRGLLEACFDFGEVRGSVTTQRCDLAAGELAYALALEAA